MNLTKQDLFVIFGCFGQQAAQGDKSLEAAAIQTIGILVTATDAEKLVMLEEMRAAAVAVMDKLPEVIQKLGQEIDALRPPAEPTAPTEELAARFGPQD